MELQKKHPIEITRLLNPAFCGQTILYCISKFEKYSKDTGMHYPLVFFVLPIILHEDTRNEIPSTTRRTFHAWLMDNQRILINLSQRITNLIPITKEALVFLSYYDKIEIKNGLINTKNFSSRTVESKSLEIQDCYQKSQVLGKWLATAGTPTTIYSILGVKP